MLRGRERIWSPPFAALEALALKEEKQQTLCRMTSQSDHVLTTTTTCLQREIHLEAKKPAIHARHLFADPRSHHCHPLGGGTALGTRISIVKGDIKIITKAVDIKRPTVIDPLLE
ncbi:hypothetical protein FSST1_011418 [Fusarium sambucinum]